MSVIVWLLSALLMLIGSCSQPVGQASSSVQRDLCDVDSGWVAYTVTAGDTLSSIAGRTGSTAEALAAGNCLDDLNLIQNGQTLYVPRTPDPLPTDNGGSQPTVAGQLEIYPWLTTNYSLTSSWMGVPADLSDGTLIELVLVLPDGSQQVVSSTDTVYLNRSREARLTWTTPATAARSAQVFARAGNYVSPIATFRIEDVQVRAFTADKTSVQPGETVTLSWSISGGTSVALYSLPTSTMIGANLPLEGSLPVTVTVPAGFEGMESAVYYIYVAAEDDRIYETMTPIIIEIPLVKP